MIRVIIAYRTISTDATQAIFGIGPIHLLVGKRARLNARQEINDADKKVRRMKTIVDYWRRNRSLDKKGHKGL